MTETEFLIRLCLFVLTLRLEEQYGKREENNAQTACARASI